MKLWNFEKKFETLILSYANMETVQPWETSGTTCMTLLRPL